MLMPARTALGVCAGMLSLPGCNGLTPEDPPNGNNNAVLWHVDEYRARGKIAVTSDLVFFPGIAHDVIALRQTTGELVWRSTTPIQSAETVGFGLAVVDNIVVFADVNLFAFDRQSGVQRWVFTGNNSNPAQSVPVGSNGRVYSGSTTGVVYAIRASEGTEIWNVPSPFTGDFLANNPTIVGDTLIVGYAEKFPGIRGGFAAFAASNGRLLWARDLSPLVPAGKLARSLGNALADASNVYGWVEHGDVVALDRRTGEVIWHRAPTGANETNWRQMSLAKGTLVVASFDGQFEGMDPANGQILWTRAVELGSVLQPTSTDGEFVFAIGSGALAAIDPSNGSYKWLLGGNGQSGYALYGTAAFDSQAVYAGGNGLWKVQK
jgi:outer membrane protein assembly factor BamB